MKARVVQFLTAVFGACLMVAVLAGGIVAVIYLIGFVAGGTLGEQMAILGSKIMKYCITLAAIGAVFGMLAFYTEGTHELVMERKQETESREASMAK